jgi:hypothetical protein
MPAGDTTIDRDPRLTEASWCDMRGTARKTGPARILEGYWEHDSFKEASTMDKLKAVLNQLLAKLRGGTGSAK